MNDIAFIKMHGLGNDFVVIDTREAPLNLTGPLARTIADRRSGVGCDQLILLEPPRQAGADLFMGIYNADGGEAEACGNATRCVAAHLMAARGEKRLVVETVAGLLPTRREADGLVTVDMGPVRLGWRDIPLAEERDTLHVGVAVGPFADPVAVNVGNPHAVFLVDDAEAAPLETHGRELEHHPMFPRRTNVGAAQVLARDRIRLRVWERGVGLTRACGSGACAALVAAHRRGLAERDAEVLLDGGALRIVWREDGHVEMAGPAAVSFHGTLDPSLLTTAA